MPATISAETWLENSPQSASWRLFTNRAAAVASTIVASTNSIAVIAPDGRVALSYVRSASVSGAAMTTNGGTVGWLPDGEWTSAHFVRDASDIPGTTADLQLWAGPTAPAEIVLNGAYLISGTIDLTASTVQTVRAITGAGITRTTDVPIWSKQGSTAASPVASTSSTVTKGSRLISIPDTPGFSVGDYVLIRSNNLTPNVTAGSRISMIKRIESLSSTILRFTSSLYRSMNDGITVRRVQFGPRVTFEGGRYTDQNQEKKRPLFYFLLCHAPDFVRVSYGNSGGPGLALHYCEGGRWVDSHVFDLRDDEPNGFFGYGVALCGACFGYDFASGRAERVRHAITTVTSVTDEIPVDMQALLANRGEPESCRYGPVYCTDTTEAALDTHEQGFGITYEPNVHGCFSAVNIRCNEASVVGGRITNTRRRAIRISGPPSNATATSTQKISISGVSITGVSLDGTGGAEASGVYVGRAGADVTVMDVSITDFREAGVDVISGAQVSIMGGLIDGGGSSGTTGIRLAGDGSRVIGTLIRDNAVGIQHPATAPTQYISGVVYDGNTTDIVTV